MNLSELCTAVVLALATDYEGTGNDRSRDVPDVRTIRYYTTLGLLDRPESMQGRTALYGRKHLLQLVAIKRLQAKGFTLTQIQAQLLGMSVAQLEQLAALAAVSAVTASDVVVPPTKLSATGRTANFWKEPVAGVHASQPKQQIPATVLQGIPLGSEVTLLLPTLRALDAHDLEGLQVVAQPLLQWLKQRRILDDSTQ